VVAGNQAGGLADSRLLAALARRQPVSILGFGNDGPGANPGIPLRVADLAEDDQGAHLTRTAYMRSVRAGLSTTSGAFQLFPVTTAAPPDGSPVLRVQATAPSPLG
jgi:hypothetical protein